MKGAILRYKPYRWSKRSNYQCSYPLPPMPIAQCPPMDWLDSSIFSWDWCFYRVLCKKMKILGRVFCRKSSFFPSGILKNRPYCAYCAAWGLISEFSSKSLIMCRFGIQLWIGCNVSGMPDRVPSTTGNQGPSIFMKIQNRSFKFLAILNIRSTYPFFRGAIVVKLLKKI